MKLKLIVPVLDMHIPINLLKSSMLEYATAATDRKFVI